MILHFNHYYNLRYMEYGIISRFHFWYIFFSPRLWVVFVSLWMCPNSIEYTKVQWPFFKTSTKWSMNLHDLWPHSCLDQICDSTQRSLCPRPIEIEYSDRFFKNFIQKVTDPNDRSFPMTSFLLMLLIPRTLPTAVCPVANSIKL